MTLVAKQNSKRRPTLGLGRWARDTGGAAAVEFGLVAPVLLLALLGIIHGGTLLARYNAMHSGVSSGAQYVMSGGSNLATAQQIASSAWAGKSGQATVTAVKICRCGTATAVCSELCLDQSVPQAFITISAADTLSGGTAVAARQEVRVR